MKVEFTNNFLSDRCIRNESRTYDNNIVRANFIKNKESNIDNATIKMVTYDFKSKFFILKAARKLREYNLKNGTKINISTDMSEIDRQVMKKLMDSQNDLNNHLSTEDKNIFYWGIRDNKLKKIVNRI